LRALKHRNYRRVEELERVASRLLNKAPKKKRKQVRFIGKCPDCKALLVWKGSKWGYFITCERFPLCRYKKQKKRMKGKQSKNKKVKSFDIGILGESKLRNAKL